MPTITTWLAFAVPCPAMVVSPGPNILGTVLDGLALRLAIDARR